MLSCWNSRCYCTVSGVQCERTVGQTRQTFLKRAVQQRLIWSFVLFGFNSTLRKLLVIVLSLHESSSQMWTKHYWVPLTWALFWLISPVFFGLMPNGMRTKMVRAFPRTPWWNGVSAEHHTGHMWRQAWHEWPTGGSVCLFFFVPEGGLRSLFLATVPSKFHVPLMPALFIYSLTTLL